MAFIAKRLRGVLTHNPMLKLLAVALAVLIWYALREMISFEMLIEGVPVEIQVKPGLAVLYQSANAADVYFKGAQEDLRALDQRQLKIVCNIPEPEAAGVNEIPLLASNVKGAHSAMAVRIAPPTIKVELDREIETQMPVKARISGQPLLGEVEKSTCEPLTVVLKGPEQHVKTIDWLYTEPIDVDGRVASFSKTAKVLAPSPSWRAEIKPAVVQVNVSIAHRSESREWKDLPVTALVKGGESVKAEISPSRASVIATGRLEMLEKLGETPPKIFVDCAELDFSVPYELPLNVHIPPGVEINAKVEPASARVTLNIPSGALPANESPAP